MFMFVVVFPTYDNVIVFLVVFCFLFLVEFVFVRSCVSCVPSTCLFFNCVSKLLFIMIICMFTYFVGVYVLCYFQQ